ncbi:MAG: hypothetical protein EA408_13345 [Marinilabiliales bacterium]|nr:MAG: hypothetical protein EA408_13345 [Marinilabiliales bacterium]
MDPVINIYLGLLLAFTAGATSLPGNNDLLATGGIDPVITGKAHDSRSDTLLMFLECRDSIDGWAINEIREVAPGDLNAHYPGIVPLFEEYGLAGMYVVTLADDTGRLIMIEVCRMGDAGGAYGLYSVTRDPGSEFTAAGDESALSGKTLHIWRDIYYIKLLSEEADKDELMKVGYRLDSSIESSGDRPRIIELIPDEEFVSDRTGYFRGGYSLSYFQPFGPDDITGFGEGAVGDFGSYRLMIFDYSSYDKAVKGLSEACGSLLNSKRYTAGDDQCPDIIFEDKDGQRMIIQAYGRYLLLYTGMDITIQPELFEQIEDIIYRDISNGR